MTAFVTLVLVLVPLVIVARGTWAVVRFARLPRQGKRHHLIMQWHRSRWRWFCRHAHPPLAYVDQHRPAAGLPGRTSVRVRAKSDAATQKLRYPKARRWRADEFGWCCRVRTIPRVGRPQLEQAAEDLANSWRCARVQVSQIKPGRVMLRGLRHDPLVEPFTEADVPPGVFGPLADVDLRDLRLYLGKDEWGEHRYVPLSGVAGITIGGMPGYGKTELVKSIVRQLAPLPVKFLFIDGKGSFDYEEYRGRALILTGDDLGSAADALTAGHDEMRDRLGSILDLTGGYTNGWHVGPHPGFELQVTIIDECHTFYDLDGVKGDKDAERLVRQCRQLTAQLVKKGRSALCLTIVITQKQTTDACPSSIRDQCAVGMSFATRTRDGSVAALGETIKDYPTYDPTTLQDPAYVGVMTARLATGADPFTRIRVPRLTAQAAQARAADLAEVE